MKAKGAMRSKDKAMEAGMRWLRGVSKGQTSKPQETGQVAAADLQPEQFQRNVQSNSQVLIAVGRKEGEQEKAAQRRRRLLSIAAQQRKETVRPLEGCGRFSKIGES